jgi:hypothetical protein
MFEVMQSECQCRTKVTLSLTDLLSASYGRHNKEDNRRFARNRWPDSTRVVVFGQRLVMLKSQHEFLPIGSAAIRRHQGLLDGELATGGPNGFQIA